MKLLRFFFLFLVVPAAITAGTRDAVRKVDPWYAGDEAKALAAKLLTYQSDYGGWPKNLDPAAPFAGEKVDLVGALKPSLESGATIDDIEFFVEMFRATKDPRYLRAVEDALDYILIAQYPTGGWPLSYPPDTTYHRYITFNYNAMVRVMWFLQEVGEAERFDLLDAGRRSAARSAFQRGVECVLKCQITVNGKLTAWCAQHDELDYRPRPGQRFELASLSGGESVGILSLLMSLDRPSPEIVRAIEAAVAWFESARIDGWRVTEHAEANGAGKNYEAVKDPAAKPLWARFYDLATDQPLFSDMDSLPRLGMENAGWARHGYAWTGDWPQVLIEKDLPAWRAKLAQTGPGLTATSWQPKVRIALAGDSTVKDEGGWGFGFKKRLGADVVCENFAGGGQSSKSFRDTGLWKKALACQPAYVLIQFGHNDGPGKGANRETDPATTYAENLTRFITEARAAGAQPILVTSLVRRIFQPDGKVRGELAPYVEAARKVAAEQHVPLIDLFAHSVELVEKLGPKGVEPFEPKILPKPAADPSDPPPAKPAPADLDIPPPSAVPRHDGTHLTARGSLEFGKIVAEELAHVAPETAAWLRNDGAP